MRFVGRVKLNSVSLYCHPEPSLHDSNDDCVVSHQISRNGYLKENDIYTVQSCAVFIHTRLALSVCSIC